MTEENQALEPQEDKLDAIAQKLVEADKKVQLVYAFNGTGKTRLSRAVKEHPSLVSEQEEEVELTQRKILYYSAFTEDLFVWDNDTENDEVRKIDIQPNIFTDWILKSQGDERIVKHFQRYTDERLTPEFPPTTEQITNSDGRRENITTYPEVNFSFRGGSELKPNIKISKGEESNFVWSVFLSLLEEAVEILLDDQDESDRFKELRYVFIDDPVSSLDENHLIELAVDLAILIKSAKDTGLKFIITTHNPLFYNVLHNELCNDDARLRWRNARAKAEAYLLQKYEDGSFDLSSQNDRPFSYHLHLLSEVQSAIGSGSVKKYHFGFLRNVLEKTATFLGHKKWEQLLPETTEGKVSSLAWRHLNLASHSAHSGEETGELSATDRDELNNIVQHIIDQHKFRDLSPDDQ
jgi:wobble nucleotide-excising tRNase